MAKKETMFDLAVRIVSKKAGFRRCGMSHPDSAVTHEPGTFTVEQLEALKGEPMLIVDVLEAPAKAKGGPKE